MATETKSILSESKNLFDWEKHARQSLEQVFWQWDDCKRFRQLRESYLSEQRKIRKYGQEEKHELMTPELMNALQTLKAKMTTLAPKRKVVRNWRRNAKGKDIMEIKVETSQTPLSGGHFGLVFDYVPYGNILTVIKLQRFENVKKSLDIYSYIMEIFIGIIIQSRGFVCTPKIMDVVRTQAGDIGCVMEKLQNTLYYFFLEGPGAKDYVRGLLILIELSEKLYRLQECFHFRHRDFRMKNVMLTQISKDHQKPECVRIIDLGKTSIVFQKEPYSAYSGVVYEDVSSDFDLGFFFADMLIHFERDRNYYKQLLMYEDLLLHFLQGVKFQSLVGQEAYLAKLMERVHLRPEKTKIFSTPEYVYRFLLAELESIKIG